MWPLACWDCGFKSLRGHGCLFLVSVVCCQVEFSVTGRSLIQRRPTECVCVCATECDQLKQYLSTPVMSRYKEVRKETKNGTEILRLINKKKYLLKYFKWI